MAEPRNRRIVLMLILLVSTTCSVWFANAMPNSRRNWDERYSLRNVQSILNSGSLRPSFAWYPSLSHLPQAGLLSLSQSLYRTTGKESFRVLKPNGRLTATAYRLCRWTSVVYGLGALLMVYWIGRRTFSTGVGLVATAVLAASPFFLKIAGTYKPDALLMLTTLAAFHLAIRAASLGRPRPYLLAGAVVGLSAAAKQNGAFSSIPLIVATGLGYRDVKRWLWLGAAGAVSVGVFLILNPWPDLLPEYLSMGERYARWAEGHSDLGLHPLLFAASLPFGWLWHGPILGLLSWLGLLGIGALAFKERRRWPSQAGPALMILFVVVLPLACSLVSTVPKGNIFVPLLPFTALAAAWALVRCRQLLERSLPRPAARLAIGVGSAFLLTAGLLPYATYLYPNAVPETTSTAASSWIEKKARLSQRVIASEAVGIRVRDKPLRRRVHVPLTLQPERLSDLPSSTLDLADYEVFPQSVLEGDNRSFYEDRIARLGERGLLIFEPALFRRRGEPLVVLAHPWRIYAARSTDAESYPEPVSWRGRGRKRLAANLPPRLRAGQVVSLGVAQTLQQSAECRLDLDGQPIRLHNYHPSNERPLFLTSRLILKKRRTRVRFGCPSPELVEPRPPLSVIRWLPRRAPRKDAAAAEPPLG